MHEHVHACAHACAHACTHVSVCALVRMLIYSCVYAHVHVCMHARLFMRITQLSLKIHHEQHTLIGAACLGLNSCYGSRHSSGHQRHHHQSSL